MEHHVCKGTCGAVSDTPGTCAADGCTHKDQPFEACGCGDKSSHTNTDGGMDVPADDEGGSGGDQ